ncbi:hypothetical protein [Ensifer aridi]|uniref:hypothetical protein n=1 Tax=Ensifer aridi TaxID=1708715 RepID=UPI00111C848F|nr:hypothetical protein [Ensifer aridi]
MDGLVKPSWLVRGNLRDNVWVIKTADPRTHLVTDVVFNFDQVVTPWPDVRSLADPEFELDLITLKLVIFYSLKPKPLGWNKSATGAKGTFRAHLAFIRWRIDRGVRANAALSSAWFNEFHTSMKKGARSGLLQVVPRVRKVIDAVHSGELILEKNGRGDVAGEKFAQLLGLSKASELPALARIIVERDFKVKGRRYSRSAAERTGAVSFKPTVTRGNANSYYRVWWDLWKLREQLAHDPIGFRACNKRSDIAKWTKSWTIEAERTDDAPAYQTSHLINAALTLLLDHVVGDVIALVRAGVDDVGEMRDRELLTGVNKRLESLGFAKIGPLYRNTRWKTSEGMTVSKFLFVVLPAAARIVTAAFSARRDEEIRTSKIDCIEDDSASNSWLNCLIVKNIDRVDRIPVPKSVVRAVSVVRQIRALGQKRGDFLYDFSCPIRNRPVKFDLGANLDLVRDYFGVPPLTDGSSWHFTPHQFRKFFGVTYYWRWAFPNLTALTFHYRHFNPETTRGYIEMKAAEALRMRDEKLAKAARTRDLERKADLDGGQTAFVSWVLMEALSGAKLGGSLGRRIMQQVKELKQQLLPEMQITQDAGTEGLAEILKPLTEKTTLHSHPEGHSICGCGAGAEDTAISKCLQLKLGLTGAPTSVASGPDFAFADDEGCLVCPHRASLPSMAPYWENAIKEAERAIIGASSDLVSVLNERKKLIADYA